MLIRDMTCSPKVSLLSVFHYSCLWQEQSWDEHNATQNWYTIDFFILNTSYVMQFFKFRVML